MQAGLIVFAAFVLLCACVLYMRHGISFGTPLVLLICLHVLMCTWCVLGLVHVVVFVRFVAYRFDLVFDLPRAVPCTLPHVNNAGRAAFVTNLL